MKSEKRIRGQALQKNGGQALEKGSDLFLNRTFVDGLPINAAEGIDKGSAGQIGLNDY